ncbi:MAG TPA: hypothetical protein VGQ12_03305 [Candidatus Angelobacter sp.]|jgi:hypothetical protein|nr:hypothetical protein [Candidatus Angelobacter sp.]
MNDEMGYTPFLDLTRKALRAKTPEKDFQLMKYGLMFESAVSNNTATESPTGTYATIEPTQMDELRLVKDLLRKAVGSYHHRITAGTMVVPQVPGMTIQAKYVDQLKATNQQLEYRLGALESELKSFRPYMKTIQRMVDEYQAGTVRAQQIVRDLRANYQPSGAIERAAQLDRDVIEGPIDRSYEEI